MVQPSSRPLSATRHVWVENVSIVEDVWYLVTLAVYSTTGLPEHHRLEHNNWLRYRHFVNV